MIELAFLILLNRLSNWGLTPIIVTRTIPAGADKLHGLVSDPANQWRLATRFADIAALEPAGDRCDAQLRLPMGASLHASVHVKPSRKGRLLTCEARLGRRTVAWVTWILTPDRGTTEVDLAVQLESRSLATRLVLLLGGRRWIARRLEMALTKLARTVARTAKDVAAAPASDVATTPDAHVPNDLSRPSHNTRYRCWPSRTRPAAGSATSTAPASSTTAEAPTRSWSCIHARSRSDRREADGYTRLAVSRAASSSGS
jgi:hypothetical protein